MDSFMWKLCSSGGPRGHLHGIACGKFNKGTGRMRACGHAIGSLKQLKFLALGERVFAPVVGQEAPRDIGVTCLFGICT